MAFFQRKLLDKPKVPDPESCPPPVLLPLPRPIPRLPTPPPSSDRSYAPVLLIMFGVLVISLCFLFYLICYTRLRLRRRQTRQTNTNLEAHEDFFNEDLGPVIHNPIWLINTIGLDQSQIDSIQVFKYKKDEKLIEGTDCSVCLSEFEDDESLRLLPKCSHAFHVPCIDTWLRSHKNCPLCRAPIFKNSNEQTERAITQSDVIESSTGEAVEAPVSDTGTDTDTIDDRHVIDVENNDGIVKTDLANRNGHVQGDVLVTMRRSLSSSQLVASKEPNNMKKSEHKLKGSSSSINICGKVTKSSSLGCSVRKASSFTSKCRPYNRSY